MKTRAITGFFFVIVMLASVLLGQYVFSVFYLIISLLCLQEFYKLIAQTGVKPNIITGMANGALVYIFMAIRFYADLPTANMLLTLLTFSFALVFFQELFQTSGKPFTNIAFTFFGILFAVLPFCLFHSMAFLRGSFNFHLPLAFLVILWTNDTGAYLSGRSLGRTKLFERHSPKKHGGLHRRHSAGSDLFHHLFTFLSRDWPQAVDLHCTLHQHHWHHGRSGGIYV